jgi:hypothetical protein
LLDEQHDGTVELAQRTLAAMPGVQRPSLSKVLKDFERDRLITVRYAAVDVLDPARLTRLATLRRDASLVVLGRMVGQSTGVSPLAVTR